MCEDNVPPPKGYALRLQSGAVYDGWILERYTPTHLDKVLHQIEAREDKALQYYRLKPPLAAKEQSDDLFRHIVLRSIAARGFAPELSHIGVHGAYVLVRVAVDPSVVSVDCGPVTDFRQVFLICREVTQWRPAHGTVHRRYLRRLTTLVFIPTNTSVEDGYDIFEAASMILHYYGKESVAARAEVALLDESRDDSSDEEPVEELRQSLLHVVGEQITAQAQIFLE